ncbi:MAG TPA: hypothetical protein VFZ00_28415 [Solirubrobacter sp.]|nr:hypothetical protein [Solirubrobacter sp.]
MVTDDAGVYTRGKVAYLLSLDHDTAVNLSVAWIDSVGSASSDGHHAATATHEFDPVLLVAEWHDVHQAADVVRGRRHDRREAARLLIITQLRAEGVTEREIAEALRMDAVTARRRYLSFLDEVLDELGGEAPPVEQFDQPSACLHCGSGKRIRTTAKRKVTELGRRRTVTVATTSSLCRPCLRERGRNVEHVPLYPRVQQEDANRV